MADIKIGITLDNKQFNAALKKTTALLKNFENVNRASGQRIANQELKTATRKRAIHNAANSTISAAEKAAAAKRIAIKRAEAAAAERIVRDSARRQQRLMRFGMSQVGLGRLGGFMGGKDEMGGGMGGMGAMAMGGGILAVAAALTAISAAFIKGVKVAIEFDTEVRKISIGTNLTAEGMYKVKQGILEAGEATGVTKEVIVSAMGEISDIVDMTTFDYTRMTKQMAATGLEGQEFGKMMRDLKEGFKLDDTGALDYMEKFAAAMSPQKFKQFGSVYKDIFESMDKLGLTSPKAMSDVAALLKVIKAPELVKQAVEKAAKSGLKFKSIEDILMKYASDQKVTIPQLKQAIEDLKESGKEVDRKAAYTTEGPGAAINKMKSAALKAFLTAFDQMDPQRLEKIINQLVLLATSFAKASIPVIEAIIKMISLLLGIDKEAETKYTREKMRFENPEGFYDTMTDEEKEIKRKAILAARADTSWDQRTPVVNLDQKFDIKNYPAGKTAITTTTINTDTGKKTIKEIAK